MLEFAKSKKLLNIDNNEKTVTGQKYGIITAMLYLAPTTQWGLNASPKNSNGCKKPRVIKAGKCSLNNVKPGRSKYNG